MTIKSKLMMCFMALSVALAGYVSCLLASHIHWHLGWITAPAILPGLSFGLLTAGWLLHRGWIGRRKAVGFVIASAVAYFAAYWSAVYTIALCGGGMILSTARLPLLHAGMIAGLVGTALLTANLAAVSADFRRKDWKTLIIIGTAVGGGLCLAGIGATSNTEAGTLANPGDRLFIFVWQLLVSGYIGMLLWAKPERETTSVTASRSRFRSRAALAVLALLLLSFVQAIIGYARRDKENSTTVSTTSDTSKAYLSAPASGDGIAWANSYRNAKFLTRAEFVRRLGPVHLTIRSGPSLSECVRDVEGIVKRSAAQHGLTLASAPTDIELVVDADINRSKITTTQYTEWGPKEAGYKMAYVVFLQAGFLTKANCRRGDKFFQLDVYPWRHWGFRYHAMGELVNFEASYTDAFRQMVDDCFATMRTYKDADDIDDGGAWIASLWPPGQNAEMQKKFLSSTKNEPGGSTHVFNGVTRFSLRPPIDLLGDAAKDFDSGFVERSWRSELGKNGHEIDSSGTVSIQHEIAVSWQTLSALPEFLRGPGGGPGVYIDVSAVRVWQENVVFDFNGELRRARRVCIWSDFNTDIALPRNQDDTARKLVNLSIRSAAKEFALSR